MTSTGIPETELCPNCRRRPSRHRPWCSTYQTAAETPKVGDIIDDSILGLTPLVSVYLRQEAIEDGTLVDCTQDFFDELNRDAGLTFDVAFTRAVFERYVEVPEKFKTTQDIK